MFKTILSALGMGLIVAGAPLPASVIIDFDAFTATPSFAGGIEDGIVIGDISGTVAVDGNFFPPTSEPNSIHHNEPGPASFTLTVDGGGTFTLTQFQAWSAVSGGAVMTIAGYLGGAPVGTDDFLPDTPDTYFTYTPTNLAGVTMDTLVFDLGLSSVIDGPTHVDDIVLELTAVPEAGESLVVITGLSGLFFGLRRRKRA